MMLMTLSLLLMLSLINTISPLKLSLTLTSLSIMMSMFFYSLTNSIFIPMCVIISFSSGMMILFSYCSFLGNYETKNLLNTMFLMYLICVISTTMFFSPSKTMESTSLQQMSMQMNNTFILLTLMIIVIISMTGINKSFFDPTKKFMQSY